ncbi:NUDIX hydrolase [Oxynema aestuarii]|jgi:ADP-ribose pyrophosphatase|uniref:NUDIX hydrolase n=1 Tax=Oxynema aestuarii AP17 TaxID=2064643 RepID=A0A6H1U3C3_9CYAN|nr:NUDIX hydrolase [Oxynema aestuarii]QIZ72119.1 NUDIX hydrolase [Oxynema aestuarii AP17]RMH74423.1 MAG: NUDIX hydrolase [Cyanobacteria bacterium J007]
MSEIKKWELLRSQLVFNNPWCRIRRDEVRLPNGHQIDDFFVNVRPDLAVVFALTERREIIFVRQYRHGVGEILLELPAGAFDPAVESAESAARREFTEETGYAGDRFIPLASLHDNPVKDTNKVHLFLVENVKKIGEQVLDITEEIELVLIPIETVRDRIQTGEICVAGTVAATFLALQLLAAQNP